MTPTSHSAMLSILHGRASLRPGDLAYTFTDYAADPAGVAQSMTWSQVSRRTMNVAREIRQHASVGDRAVILAPQGLEYVLAFLGSIQAGLVAVPLPLPHRGSSYEGVSAVFADTNPAVVLTTSAAAEDVGHFVDQSRMEMAPKIVEIDSLDLDVDGESIIETADYPSTAYLQYSSGSTRRPTGVMISHRNMRANFEQLTPCYFSDTRARSAGDSTFVSWLPFYHDMGLGLGICLPILRGSPAVLLSPLAFLEKPSRWIRALAQNPHAFSAAPNFALDLAARRTTDADLAGLDLGGVASIVTGAERVDPGTLERFADRFAHFKFKESMLLPSYGLAEATVFVAAGTWSERPEASHFDVDELSAGRARRCATGKGSALVSYALPQSPLVRIVDADTSRECAADVVGEIWIHGGNVADGYFSRSPEEQRCFGATIVEPSPGTVDGPWLRTGDLGFISSGELFIVGRIKDLLIIRGRNHYPEDIEATVTQITGGRVAAISVPVNGTEQLVTVIEAKQRGDSPVAKAQWLQGIKSDVTAAISNAHGLNVGDVVLVHGGSIPTTTSGKVRRAACVEQYQQDEFTRLDG